MTRFMLIAALLFAATIAVAQNPDLFQSNDMNAQTAGDINTGSDKVFAVGGSSFDVDINQCLASKATNIVIVGWQTLKENPTCIADGLDARGNHDAAAQVRCTHVDTIVSAYDDFKQCIKAVTMVPVEPPKPPQPPKDTARDKDEDDGHGHDYEALQQQLAALVEDKARTDRAAARYATQQREEKQQDRLYAQQLIEEIQQIEEPANCCEESSNEH